MNKKYISSMIPFLLLALDGADGAGSGGDVLDADVGDKELTKFPILKADRMLKFMIVDARKEAQKKDPTKELLVVPCILQEDATSTDDDIIHKGFPITLRIGLSPTDKRTVSQIAGDIARICQAVGLSGVKVRDIIENPGVHLNDKLMIGKTKIQPEKDGYPASSTITPIPVAKS